ncbi:MAG: DUF2520 domain-containing protein [Ignavibacteriales bacterium]|nr:DUF2520 domain-containing protein [Ignavibacteriales bacterium]
MENLVRQPSPPPLTGPIVRGDLLTVELHLKTLSKHAPQYLPLYTVGGIEAARIAKEHGKLSQQDFNNIISLFKTFIKSTSTKHTSKVKR